MENMENNIKKIATALIPMKAHSERVPNKNIRNFDGKPLYYYILDALSQSKYIKDIYIDTDSEIVAEKVSKIFSKIKIINRPQKLRGDFVSMNDIIFYDLSQIDNEYFLQTHVTNPLLTTRTIDRAIETFFKLNREYDSLFSVTELRIRLYDKNAKPINHNPNKLLRTQELSPLYEENSNLYIFTKDSFSKNNNNRIGRKPFIFKINKLESIDIDTLEDFKLAEAIKKAGFNKLI